MTVEGRVQLRNDLVSWLREIRGELQDNALEAGLEAGEKGMQAMRTTIEHTPSGLSPGKSNRILTGNMWDKTTYKVSQSGHSVRVQVGWLNVKAADRYFEAQELGLGPVTFGMHALTHAEIVVKNELKNRGYG